MFNLSDKELDRLSREAADAYEVEKNTSSWETLEQRLDQELGTAPTPNPAVPPPRTYMLPLAYTSLIILLVSSGYFLLKSGKKTNTANTKNYTLTNQPNQQSDKNNQQNDILAPNRKKENTISTNENAVNNTSNKNESANAKKESDNSSSVLKNEVSKKNNADTKLDKEKTRTVNSNNMLHGKEIVATEKPTGNNNQISGYKPGHYAQHHNKNLIASGSKTNEQKENENNQTINASGSNSTSIVDDSRSEKSQSDISKNNSGKLNGSQINSTEDLKYASFRSIVPVLQKHLILINDSALRAEPMRNQDLISLNKKSKSLNINRSLQIGISFAPDFSKVKYAYENNHLGSSIGLTLGYQVLHRLSVNTGVLYSKKYYQADADDFHPQMLNAALSNEHIDFVNGSFKMIELPLNLRYDFSIQGNTSFFINGGLSSYMILGQNNAYYCHDNIGYQRWIRQSYNKNEIYWFSAFNFSMGFEANISNNISLQVDPYVKLPLNGMGIGEIKLSSYGINMAIKYSPVLKRSRHLK